MSDILKESAVSTYSISKIMHRHVITAGMDITARECAERIAENRIGCLIIIDKNKPIGIVTERSFVDLVKNGSFNPDEIKASDFMSSPLITIKSTAEFTEAMRVFNTKNIKRLPVVSRNRIVGLLSLKDMIEFSNLALARLTEKHRKLKDKSAKDPLTGTLNKEAITRAIKKEYDRIRRYGGKSSILFLDIDHFKNINDTYSHIVGDKILKQLGALLKKTCREIDTIGRFGGEEFIILAPNRKKYHAVAFGERLRQTVENYVFKAENLKLKITVSIGIASLFAGRDYKEALMRSDKALYFAKESGRNRVGLFRDGKLTIASY